MLFVTWNVNSLRARLPRVLELLAHHQPDVVALQETKCSVDNFCAAELLAAGYQVIHHSGGQWAGVALLARASLVMDDPILGLPGEPPPAEARWCEATVDGIRVASTYVPNGRTLDSPEYPRKLAFLEAMADHAARMESPLLIAGDFNIAPADPDVYDPAAFINATHTSAPERERLRAIIDRAGLLDAYRQVHPDEQQFTWWDYRAGNFHKNLGMRIDLALVSADLASRIESCGIDRDFRKGQKPSDHAPLLVRLH